MFAYMLLLKRGYKKDTYVTFDFNGNVGYEVFLKKVKLIAHAFFEVISKINIKVLDWIVDDLRKFPQSLLGFFNDAHWRRNVLVTYLKQLN